MTTLFRSPKWVDPFICQYEMRDVGVCQKIIDSTKPSIRWSPSKTVGGLSPVNRDSSVVDFSADMPPVEHEPMLTFMQECMAHYLEAIPAASDVPMFGLKEGYSVLRYEPNQAYHAFHSDAGYPHLVARHLTTIVYLNTLEEGGDTEFKHQELKISPVAGRSIIFPAWWGYTHRSVPSPETRYVLNGFHSFLEEQ